MLAIKRWFFNEIDYKKDFIMDNLMTTEIFWLQCGGQWPVNYTRYIPEFFPNLNRVLNFIYYAFLDFLLLHLLFLYIITLLITFMDPEATIMDISNSIILVIIYFYASFSVIFFQFNHKKATELIEFMNQNFKRRSAKGLTYVTLEPSYYLSRKYTLTWLFMVMFGTTHVAVVPVLNWTRMLSLQCYYPFDPLVSPVYEIIFLSQFAAQMMICLSFCNPGNVLMGSVMLVCGQFDILFDSLKNIRYTAMLNNGNHLKELKKLHGEFDLSKEEEEQFYYSFEQMDDLDLYKSIKPQQQIQQQDSGTLAIIKQTNRASDTYLMEFNEELTDVLKDCIHHHQMILQFCMMLEAFLSPLILVKSLQITSQICNLTFVCSKTRIATMFNNLPKVEYLFLTLLELFIFGYSGNWLKIQSTRVGEALLRCPWHLCGGPFRRGIMMILSNTARPLVVTGGKFFILDYDKIKSIIAASFSYYTLLQKLGT